MATYKIVEMDDTHIVLEITALQRFTHQLNVLPTDDDGNPLEGHGGIPTNDADAMKAALEGYVRDFQDALLANPSPKPKLPKHVKLGEEVEV